MTPARDDQAAALSRSVLKAFDNLNGSQPGYRPAHAKGVLLSGRFTPSPAGSSLTRAPHLHRPSTPVTVRFSDFAGIPVVPDNDPNASPRGMATRFHLAEHIHTDIVAHSVDGFPARTAEEFVEFLQAAGASGPAAPKPSPIELFLASHPAAMEFVQAPKPFPFSFANESFFAVNAYKFTSEDGVIRFGRYRVRPDAGANYLTPEAAAAKSPNFLMDEIKERVTKEPARFRIFVQLAEPGDIVDNSTIHWPESGTQVEFGMIEVDGILPNNDGEQKRIIFDPIPRGEGIDPA
jgi:catalase